MEQERLRIYEFATGEFSVGLREDAAVQWLRQAKDGRELVQAGVPLCKVVLQNGEELIPAQVAPSDALWRFTFPDHGWLDLRIEAKKRYLRIAVVELSLPGASRLIFCQFSPLLRQYLGRMAGLASDEQSGVCLRSLSLKVATDFQPDFFQAWTQVDTGLDGAAVGIAAGLRKDLLDMLKEMTLNEPVPFSPHGGAWAGDSELNRGSYVFADVEARDIDRWIEICRRGACSFLHFHFWWQALGHYSPRKEHFPGGLSQMKECCEKVRAAGLRTSMHTLTGCIGCEEIGVDEWVSPVPSADLIALHSYTVTQNIALQDTLIEVAECPENDHDLVYTYSGNGNVLRIGQELVQYQEISREKPYAFKQCIRGAFGTRPYEHPAGCRVDYLQQRYLAFYPEPDSVLAGALAEHIAAIYNDCKMEMLYFDGSEGMRSRYAVDAMRWKIFALLNGGVTEASEHGHNSWWLHSRLGAMDSPVWGVKRFVDMHLKRAAAYRKADLMEPQMGWWSVLGTQRDFRGQLTDEIEYFAVKNLSIDSPMSVQTVAVSDRFHWVNGRVWELMTLLGWYERMRKARYFSSQTLQRLATPEAEFRLRLTSTGQWRFFPMTVSRHRFTGNAPAENGIWEWNNPEAGQSLCLRLEALYAAEPASNTEILLDWSAPKGTVSETAAESVDLQCALLPATPGMEQGVRMRLQAANRRDSERGAWACLCVQYPHPYKDFGDCEALSVWVKGDASAAVLNFQIGGPREYGSLLSDHYVELNFIGWRRFELLFRERDTERATEYEWPYSLGTGNYSMYRTPLTRRFRQHIEKISVYVNDIPAGGKVDVEISALTGLPCQVSVLDQPVLLIDGQKLRFPVQMTSGQYIEMEGVNDCALYDERGFLLRRFRAEGVKQIKGGMHQIKFEGGAGATAPRAELTLFSLGEPFGEANAVKEIDWIQLQREYELPRQMTAFDGLSNRWILQRREESARGLACEEACLELEIKANHIAAGQCLHHPVFLLNGQRFCFPVDLQNDQLICCRDRRHWHLFDGDNKLLQEGLLANEITLLPNGGSEVGLDCENGIAGDFRITVLLCKVYRKACGS